MDNEFKCGRQTLLEAGAQLGRNVKIKFSNFISVGLGVVIGDDAILVADSLVLGDGVKIGKNSDLRSAKLKIGSHSEVGINAEVIVSDKFSLGAASRIERNVSIVCREFSAGKLFYFGHDSSVGYGGTKSSTSILEIGNRVALGPHSILNANLPIKLDDQVGSGCNLTIWTHGFHFGHSVLDGYSSSYAPVHVSSNVWLGYHVTLLPGITIGENTILAAGSIVTQSLPENSLAAGTPARVKRKLNVQPLDLNQGMEAISGLLSRWVEELNWKGVLATMPNESLVIVGEHKIHLISEVQNGDLFPAEASIIISQNDISENSKRANCTYFELKSGSISGDLDPVSHDLRDFLRRATLPCGDDIPFHSIEPNSFSRLRRAI